MVTIAQIAPPLSSIDVEVDTETEAKARELVEKYEMLSKRELAEELFGACAPTSSQDDAPEQSGDSETGESRSSRK